MIWKYFTLANFACRHCGENRIHPELIDKLELMREYLGFPLIVSSGYRCSAHNSAVSSTGEDGPHTTGWAVDISVRGAEARLLLQCAMDHGFTGLGISQKGESRFLHLDLLTKEQGFPRPTVWSY